tara:strand:- start:3264 stop:3962 length:699 start_codon:yes stop_codon:yes gene_type:complete
MSDKVEATDAPELAALWKHTHSHSEKISNLEKIAARLEVGQDSLEDKIDRGFAGLQADLHRTAKPPFNVIGVATLAFLLLGGFGAVLTYMIGWSSEATKREIDLRFEAVIANDVTTSSTTRARILAMDKRFDAMLERMAYHETEHTQDMYDKGVMVSKFRGLEQNFYHLDDQLHIKDRRSEDHRVAVKERLSVIEETRRHSIEDRRSEDQAEGLNQLRSAIEANHYLLPEGK